MGYQPIAKPAPCSCGRMPFVKRKWFLSSTVRLECECGIAGAWVQWDIEFQMHAMNAASAGWPFKKDRPPPPKPSW